MGLPGLEHPTGQRRLRGPEGPEGPRAAGRGVDGPGARAWQDSPASPSEVPGRAAAKPAWEHGLARGPDGHVQVTGLPPGGVGGPCKRGWRRGSSPTPPSGLWAPRWPQRSLTRSSQRSPGGACRPADGPAAPRAPLCLAKRSPLLKARLILNAQGLGGLEGFPAQACRGGQPGPACCVSLGEDAGGLAGDASVPGQAGAAPPGTDAPSPRVPCEPQA